MTFKYQVVFLGTLTEEADKIINLFLNEVDVLHLSRDAYSIIKNEKGVIDNYTGNQPTYVVYFGNDGMHEDISILQKLIKDGNPVLPVFYNSFSREIPAELKNQNGLQYGQGSDIRIVNLILEAFGKLRNTRKIFISYKRDQSTSVAIQLFEALEKSYFDVFLDTHSIIQGEPFQDELWHRMTDCDVIVSLNTSKFLTSEWCEKEVAESSAKRIGVIQLIWPDNKLERMAEICFPKQLVAGDFINAVYDDMKLSKLTDTTVSEIIRQVESVRARNLASRQDDIITNFLNTARAKGKHVNLQPDRFITEDIGNNRRRIFIPLVGIPQSINYGKSSALKKEIAEHEVKEVVLIYDDLRIREHWIKHLDYLNEHLDVQTLSKQKFESWLTTN